MDDSIVVTPVQFLVEGVTDEAVAKRLLDYVGLTQGNSFGKSGKPYLLSRLLKYNKAARFSPWFALVDLDNDAPCASQAIGVWLPTPETKMVLRVAVRAVEAWLMADVEQMAAFLHVSPSRFPDNPDAVTNPKEKLINIARSSTSSNVRTDFVPRQGSGAREGPLYADRLNEFTTRHWRPDEAMLRSDSLRRCVNALLILKNRYLSEG